MDTLLVLAMQITMPADGTNPYAWFLVIALGGIGFMFLRYDGNTAKRTERCETQQDALLADNRAQAATIKEQSTTLLRIASLAENTVEGIKVTHQKVDNIERLLDERLASPRRPS